MYLELSLVKYISTFTLYRDSMLLGYLVLAISVILHGSSHLIDCLLTYIRHLERNNFTTSSCRDMNYSEIVNCLCCSG